VSPGLSKRQRKGLRRAPGCVVCHKPYPPDVDRSRLYVYPDGCTAHNECGISETGSDIAHWHTVEAKREDDLRVYVDRRNGSLT
jgi:hypothetical protein